MTRTRYCARQRNTKWQFSYYRIIIQILLIMSWVKSYVGKKAPASDLTEAQTNWRDSRLRSQSYQKRSAEYVAIHLTTIDQLRPDGLIRFFGKWFKKDDKINHSDQKAVKPTSTSAVTDGLMPSWYIPDKPEHVVQQYLVETSFDENDCSGTLQQHQFVRETRCLVFVVVQGSTDEA